MPYAAGYPTGPAAPPEVPLDVPDNVFSRVQATPEDFGSQVGRSMTALGQVLATSASELSQVALERQQLHNQVVSDNQINNFSDRTNNLLYGDPNAAPGTPEAIGFYGLRGQAAIDAYPKIRAALQAGREELRGALENPMQQMLFDAKTRRQMSFDMGLAGDHYDKQYDAFQTETNAAGAALSRQETDRAALANDDAAFNASVGRTMNWEMKQLQAAGEDKNPAAVNAMLSRVRQDAVERRIKGYIGTGNTDAAARVLTQEAGPDGALSVEQAAAYRKILDGIEADRAAHRALQPRAAAGSAVEAITPFATGNAAPGGPSPVSGLREDFAQRILAMTQAMPPEIRAKFQITSGYRSEAREAEVYAAEHPGEAVPQHSKHSDGLAADIGSDRDVINWITAHPEFGLGFPLAAQHGEANHMEMVGSVTASAAPTATAKPATAGEGAIVVGPHGQRLQNTGGRWIDLSTGRPYEEQSAGP